MFNFFGKRIYVLAFTFFVIMCFHCFVHLEAIEIHTKLQIDAVFVKGLSFCRMMCDECRRHVWCMKRGHVFVAWGSFCWYLVSFCCVVAPLLRG